MQQVHNCETFISYQYNWVLQEIGRSYYSILFTPPIQKCGLPFFLLFYVFLGFLFMIVVVLLLHEVVAFEQQFIKCEPLKYYLLLLLLYVYSERVVRFASFNTRKFLLILGLTRTMCLKHTYD